MIGTIRKHQQWLWAIIITLTIASFIYWGGNRGPHDAAGRTGDFGTVNGERVTKEDYLNAYNEALLQYFFSSGGRFYNEQDAKKANFNLEQRTYIRLLLVKKQDQFGVRVSSEKAGQFATRMVQQFERGASMNPNEFVTQHILQPQRLTLEDFDRFVRHELGIQELISSIGLGGALVTPQEAQELYRREHQELATEAVFFSASNYLASVTNSPQAIAQFYTNQQANYRLPERVQVSYVRFPYTNYYDKAEKLYTNLSERVDAEYQRLGTNSFMGAKTPEESKAKIREEILRMTAAPMAQKDANQFAAPLFENNPLPLADFSKLTKSNSLEVATSPPFSRDETPKGLDVGMDFTTAAFGLSPTDPYAQPIKGRDAIYVIAFDKRLPSELPSFDSIKDKVTADFKLTQAMMKARTAGIEFSQSVSNGIAAGKTFAAVAAEARLKVVELPPLALTTKDVTNLDENVPAETLKEVAFSTPPGKVSPFRPVREGGLIVHVKSKLPLDEAKMKADLAGFVAYVRQARQREAFDSWFRKELQQANIRSPILERQQQESVGQAARS